MTTRIRTAVNPGRVRRISLPGLILRVFRQHRERRKLARLDDHMLDDIGVNRAEALREARRPIWDVPENWLK
ncbi:hypothetical protein DDZ14_03500 [Maritimibacter sp. 55A14]|uniref:DUF1127 domain-containing protein n=1 Tax=Maritimibacter sp. 55A14 TaxID=2174844 RepID=UPI000D622DB8|nr:DUF1127 domain-containing protein [Maritimibacter sp. 55A14]PWE33742.1 hypothetical protein DDZ14_03500 [Maritimibacter sp. 55A14]